MDGGSCQANSPIQAYPSNASPDPGHLTRVGPGSMPEGKRFVNLLTALAVATAILVLPMLASAGTADNPVPPAPTPSPTVIIIGEPS